MENEMIRLEGIKKKYRKGTGEVLALDGVSLSISKGGFTAITGRSGSGKSTLMNIMGCLDTADSGRYFTDDEPRHMVQSAPAGHDAANEYRKRLYEFLVSSIEG